MNKIFSFFYFSSDFSSYENYFCLQVYDRFSLFIFPGTPKSAQIYAPNIYERWRLAEIACSFEC